MNGLIVWFLPVILMGWLAISGDFPSRRTLWLMGPAGLWLFLIGPVLAISMWT